MTAHLCTIERSRFAKNTRVRLVFLAMILFSLSGPIMEGQASSLSGDGNFLRQFGYLIIAAAVSYSCGIYRDARKILAVPTGIIAVLGWFWLSSTWAIDPSVSIRRLILITILIPSIFISVNEAGSQQAMKQIGYALSIVLALNYAVTLLAPQMGIHQYEVGGDPSIVGAWHGLTGDKNYTGSVCAITIIVFILGNPNGFRPFLRYAIIFFAGVFLFLTNSRTSMLSCGLSIVLGLLYKYYNARYWPFSLTSLSLVCLILIGLISYGFDPFTPVLNDRNALTGRTQIWPMLLLYINDNWLLGSGYGSFWNIGSSSPVYRYGMSGSWITEIASGHNGYLDLAAQVGVTGLVLTVCTTVLVPLLRLLFRNPTPHAPFACSVITFVAIQNLTESTLFERDAFASLMLFSSLAILRAENLDRPL